MRSACLSLLLGSVFHLAAAADDAAVVVVDPPKPGVWCEFKADPGRQLVLKCAKATEWSCVDDAGQLTAFGEQAVFSASEPARYRIVAVADGKLVRVGVTVGKAPNPGPPPPTPADVLRAKLKAAVDQDGAAAEDVKKLAALYRQAVKTCADPSVPSTAALLVQIRDASVNYIGSDVLKTTRGVVAVELRAALGKSSDEAITQKERDAAAGLFGKLAEILEGL